MRLVGLGIILLLYTLRGDASSVTGTESSVYQTLIQTELEGWSDPTTGSTIKLEGQCGVDFEFHLAGSHRQNFLLIGVLNSSDEIKTINYQGIRFLYDGEKIRYPGEYSGPSTFRLPPFWWQISWVPFPSKKEFKHVKRIKVEIPVVHEKGDEVCLVETVFQRTKHTQGEEGDDALFEIIFDAGPSLEFFSFESNFYLKENHGLGMVLSRESHFEDRDADASYLGIQYVFRKYLKENFFFTLGIGPGVQFVSEKKERAEKMTRDLTVADKWMIHWRFHQLKTKGAESLDFFIGTGVYHFWTPNSEINGRDISGHRFGSLLRLGIGF